MSEPGYIYVLINPSMEGLAKVGKTTRDPEGRVRELSAATGVPTPFYLAYRARFSDCAWAEETIHGRLASKGYRLSKRKEFFKAPLNVIVETVLEVQAMEAGTGDGNEPSVGGDVAETDRTHEWIPDGPWAEPYTRAQSEYYGLSGVAEDKAAALRDFIEAFKRGCAVAPRQIGRMYEVGDGCERDAEKAREWFEEGVSRGDGRCLAELGWHYYWNLAEPAKSEQSWRHYFASPHFRMNITYDDPFSSRGNYARLYVFQVRPSGIPVALLGTLASIRDEILAVLDRSLEFARSEGAHDRIEALGAERRGIESL